MDYKKLIEKLRFPTWYDLEEPDSTLLADAATAITALLARAEKAERERDAAVSDMEALMWHSGDGCNICAHSVEAHRVPYVRLTCYLKGNCEPKWRGIKEE